MVLAQLDAALAHELADRARARANDATALVAQSVREGKSASYLAQLREHEAGSTAAATKARALADMATGIVLALGGSLPLAGADSCPPSESCGEAAFDHAAVDAVSAAALVDVIAALEVVKNAAAAVQVQAQAVFMAQQRLIQARAGVPRENLGRGIAQQVGLARHESPHRGRQLCELATVLVREMPHTMAVFASGTLNEYRASIMVRETACLSVEDRAQVDYELCGGAEQAGLLGSKQLAAAAKRAAYSLDPAAVAKRFAKAETERHVSLRPAADGMTLLTALIPLKQGVRIYNILSKVADSAKAGGDDRGKGQLMADALMHRLIQHEPCRRDHEPGSRGEFGTDNQGMCAGILCTSVAEPDIALALVMTDRALFDGANDPAVLVGYDPIPAPTARAWIVGTGTHSSSNDGRSLPRVWLKRLFTHPASNTLLGMDSKGRLFPEGMKEFLRLRDQRCATPYCDAPIREYDHIKSWASGGGTTVANGQGLCTACNQAKESPDWTSNRINRQSPVPLPWPDPGVRVTTPTGHRYVSIAPPLPGSSYSPRSKKI